MTVHFALTHKCRTRVGRYGLIYLSAILWRVVKAANRIVLFFLGLIVLIQVVSALNGPEGGGVLDDTLILMPASSMPS